ncbi:hypothetical protein CCE02nite_00170 [Cellulosimicrobium cellulans]|uniref:Exosortase/archaeosortase family protein n=1 Tax=Cellulosimicrobium cellulans TaxID=1710 RepID=A0A4Y4DXA6_CELCE|nr:hypothetical protein CCE02nite_00170 [Cellulosimicrobium cellulans]
MTDHALPPVASHRGARALVTAPRLALTIALIAATVFLLAAHELVRTVEARIVALAIGLVVPGTSDSVADVVVFAAGGPGGLGIQISFMCSTVVLLAPLLLTAAVVAPFRRFSARNVVRGLAVSSLIAVAANLARFVMIAYAYHSWGGDGFDVTHHLVGSLFVIACFVVAFAVLVRTVGRPTP